MIPFPAEDWRDQHIREREDISGQNLRGAVLGSRYRGTQHLDRQKLRTRRNLAQGLEAVRERRDLRLVGITDNKPYAGKRRKFFRSALRITTGDNDARAWIRSMDFADRVACLRVCRGRHSASVKDNDVGGGTIVFGAESLVA